MIFIIQIKLSKKNSFVIKEKSANAKTRIPWRVEFIKKENNRRRVSFLLNVNVITQLEDFYEHHRSCKATLEKIRFSGNTAFAVFPFYESPRSLEAFLLCDVHRAAQRQIDTRCASSSTSVLSLVGNLSV